MNVYNGPQGDDGSGHAWGRGEVGKATKVNGSHPKAHPPLHWALGKSCVTLAEVGATGSNFRNLNTAPTLFAPTTVTHMVHAETISKVPIRAGNPSLEEEPLQTLDLRPHFFDCTSAISSRCGPSAQLHCLCPSSAFTSLHLLY